MLSFVKSNQFTYREYMVVHAFFKSELIRIGRKVKQRIQSIYLEKISMGAGWWTRSAPMFLFKIIYTFIAGNMIFFQLQCNGYIPYHPVHPCSFRRIRIINNKGQTFCSFRKMVYIKLGIDILTITTKPGRNKTIIRKSGAAEFDA